MCSSDLIVPASVVKSLRLDTPAGSGGGASSAAEVEEDGGGGGEEDDADGGTGPWMLLLSSQGKGKRIALDDFKQQKRGGSGKKGLGLFKGDRLAALCLTGMHSANNSSSGEAQTSPEAGEAQTQSQTQTVASEHVIIGSQEGVMNRFDVDSIRVQKGRATKGAGVMKLKEGDSIRDITLLPPEDVALLPPSSSSSSSSSSGN